MVDPGFGVIPLKLRVRMTLFSVIGRTSAVQAEMRRSLGAARARPCLTFHARCRQEHRADGRSKTGVTRVGLGMRGEHAVGHEHFASGHHGAALYHYPRNRSSLRHASSRSASVLAKQKRARWSPPPA
jgi:hypothetical protein